MGEFEIFNSWKGFINHMHVGVAWTVLIFFFVSSCKLINFYLKSKLINFILTVESPPRFYATCISISRVTRETRFALKSFFFYFYWMLLFIESWISIYFSPFWWSRFRRKGISHRRILCFRIWDPGQDTYILFFLGSTCLFLFFGSEKYLSI